MNKIISLDKIDLNKKVKIINIDNSLKIKQRLNELGICENSYIKCLYSSIFNDPKAYLVKGCIISLRDKDAKKIKVTYEN